MLLILCAWAVTYLLLVGMGLLISGFLFGKKGYTATWLSLFWVGWAFTLFILQLWHLFFRVDSKALALVSLLGVAGILLGRSNFQALATRRPTFGGMTCGFFVFAAVLIANRAVLPPMSYDSGLYHLGAVAWTAGYKIVPGLGNLHGRLAFNSSYFPYVALFEVFRGHSHHFANGLLILVLAAEIFDGVRRVCADKSVARQEHVFLSFLLFPLVMKAFNTDISSPSPDFVIFILGVVLSSRFLRFLSTPDQEKSAYQLFVITTISIVAVIVKLSALAIATTISLLSIYIWVRKNSFEADESRPRVLIWIVACAIIVFATWIIRSVVQTGYPVYPESIGGLPVEWRIPRASVINNVNRIRSWARVPHKHWSDVLSNWDWVLPWLGWAFKDGLYTVVLPLFLSVSSGLAMLYRKLRHGLEFRQFGILWVFLLPPIAGAAFWFLSAPAPRFAGATFWILAAGMLTLAAFHSHRIREIMFVNVAVSVLLFARFLVHGEIDFLRVLSNERDLRGAFQRLHLNLASSTERRGFHETASVEYKEFQTNSGLILYVPRTGDQCWQAPLPCTPYPNSTLRLRKANDLGSGFMVYPRDESYSGIGIRE